MAPIFGLPGSCWVNWRCALPCCCRLHIIVNDENCLHARHLPCNLV